MGVFLNVLVALDIDGTITDRCSGIADEVIAAFRSLHREGVRFAFVTGRSYRWAVEVLGRLEIPYFLAIHNGAFLLKMPEEHLLESSLLAGGIFFEMDEICMAEPTDYVLYTGYSGGDLCYYRPARFDEGLSRYLKRRAAALNEEWREVENFAALPADTFASFKCFGRRESLEKISNRIEERLSLHAPINKDPFDSSYYVLQATQKGVDKGRALQRIASHLAGRYFLIAAGDDYNDIPMARAADFSIAMETAPKELLDIADLVAPSAEKRGIIEALHLALAAHRERLLS